MREGKESTVICQNNVFVPKDLVFPTRAFLGAKPGAVVTATPWGSHQALLKAKISPCKR